VTAVARLSGAAHGTAFLASGRVSVSLVAVSGAGWRDRDDTRDDKPCPEGSGSPSSSADERLARSKNDTKPASLETPDNFETPGPQSFAD
jgi:hypothetical protein